MITLRQGSAGVWVRVLRFLLGLGDGRVFDEETYTKLKQFQTDAGLEPDGVCGEKTWGRLLYERAEVPDYKQYDSRWANKMYSAAGDKTQTVRSSGCGPTAAADAVSALTGSPVTPDILADLALSWGDRTRSSGTAWSFFPHVAGEYGLSLTRTADMGRLKEKLSSGAVCVVSFGPSRWTKGGHYCAIYAYDGTYFYIRDPASSSAARARGTESEVKAARKMFFCFENART